MSDTPVPVLKGTLDVLVLKALASAPMHSFEVLTWLEQHSRSGLDVDDAALYQALHRLEGRGLIAAEWGVTENNRRARFYELTALGRKQLRQEASRWRRLTQAVSLVLGPDFAEE